MTLKFSKLSSCLDTVDVILTKGIRKKKESPTALINIYYIFVKCYIYMLK